MAAALNYGRRHMGATAPNPCVAALVVRDGIIVGRGVTAPGGRPHGEPQALRQAGPLANGATLYVTLEPCSHHGRTPPCADAIVAAGVARVVAALGDPDTRVSGRGFERLRGAGLAVVEGVGAAQARRDHLGHVHRVVDGRPFLMLKLAETPDGFAAGAEGGERLMITGSAANAWVHGTRALHDAVMVGIGTALADDPVLTVRLPGMEARQPSRIILDRHARLPATSRLARTARETPVLLLTDARADAARVERLTREGVEVIAVAPEDRGEVDAPGCLRALAARGFTRIFCEGGPRLARALLRADLVDDLVLLTGTRPSRGGVPALDAGSRALLAPGTRFDLVETRMLGPDRLSRYERHDPCSRD